MKKFAILAAVVALIGCAQNDEGLDNITSTPEKSQTEFYASMPECDTRTYVEDNKYLRWNAGDEITVFAGNSYNGHWQFAGDDGANSGKFNEVEEGGFITGTPLDLTANYAIYPYDENITITEAGAVSLTLPAVQEYNPTYANSFGAGANTMMAVTKNTSDNFLSFKNLCGYLKLKFYGNDVTVKSVTVKGNNGEKIAGKATVSMAYDGEPTITMGDDATSTITIDCGEGVTLSNDAANPTTFWVVIPEITFEGGITIEVTDINDQIFEKKTANAVPIENNLIQPMAVLGVECAPAGPANNEIWYTNGSATEATTPYKTDVFGANIVSNTYDAEKECWVIKFDGDVTTIGDTAFYNCTSLTSVTIPNSVTSIGDDAFYKCYRLPSVTIPDGVTSIGRYAFSKCSGLTSITIPDSVTSIGAGAFNYCTGELIVNCNIPSASGYNYGAFYGSEFTSVTIGDGVTTIGSNAFYNCSSLTTITISDSVTTIEWDAFRFCDSLTSVTIGDSVTSIGSHAFSMCTSLQEFKGNIASEDGRCLIIGGVLQAFAPAGITEYTIPDGVTSIGRYAFSVCKGLTSVTIPNSVTTIGEYAFDYCKSLTSITIPDSVTTIGECAFSDCSSLTSVTIGNSVTTIGDSAFDSCSSLESVTIGNSVTTIGDSAFSNCSNLTGVYITDIAAWCNISFETASSNPLDNGGNLYINNELVADLTIPDSVTEIGDYAFIECSSLTSVTIPDSVTTIGSYALAYCDSLTSITIPDSVTTIGDSAFQNCSGLTSVTIPNSVTTIGGYALAYCDSLASITIPDSVTMIESGTFRGCINLTSATIPNSISIIDVYAFCDCTSLTSVTIPYSVTEIGDRAFRSCSSLTSVYCNPTTPPTGTPYMFQDNAPYRKIYVPAESVEAYKSASGWSEYKSYIVGYNF